MLFGAVIWRSVLGWYILSFYQFSFIVLDEIFLDIVGYGKVNLSLVAVPIKRDSDVNFARPVLRDVVVDFKYVHQVSSVLDAFCI